MKPHELADLGHAINRLATEAHHAAIERGWWEEGPEGRGDLELLALIHSEVSEAVEACRLSVHGTHASDHCPEISALAEELADVLIRVGDMAAVRGIDLGAAVLAKMAFNSTRPHRHGGKLK